MFLVLAGICLSVFFSMAEEPRLFLHFNDAHKELSHNGVLCLLEDSRGYVWIGTKMGLNRYDGRSIRRINSPELPSEYITSLCEDHDGNIWIGTSDGLACYSSQDASMTIIAFPLHSIFKNISSISCSSTGEIWFDVGGTSLYSVQGRHSEVTEHKLNLPKDRKKMCFDTADRLVVNCVRNGLYIIEDGQARPLMDGWTEDDFFENDELNNPVFSRNRKDILYIASKRRGLCALDIRDKTVNILYKWAPAQKPVNIFEDNEGVIYVATSSGLVKYDSFTGQVETIRHQINNEYSLSGDYLTCILVDSKCGLWVGSREFGLNYSARETLFHKICSLSTGQSLNGCVVRALSEDSDGNIWVATERFGLLKYHPKDNRLDRVYEDRLPFFITSVLCEGTNVWLGTQNGIICLDREKGNVRYYNTDRDARQENRVLSLFCSRSSEVFAGCTSGALKYDKVKDSFVPIRELTGFSIEGFAESENSTIWMATYSDGVIAWKPDGLFPLKQFGGQTSNMLSSVFVDKDRVIWAIGNGADIARYDAETSSFTKVDKSLLSEAPSASFTAALQDRDGYIWISTSSGLFRLDPFSFHIRHFTMRDGLLDDGLGKAVLKTSSGQLAFGSQDGFVIMSPEINTIIDRHSSYTDLTSVFVNGRKVSYIKDNTLQLPSGSSSLRFDFATPQSGAASAVYARMSPIENSPREVSNKTFVRYDNLQPGTYTLELTGHSPVRIVIAKPFFQSTKGQILLFAVVLFSILIIFLIASFIARRSQKRKAERERFKQDQALLQDKMSFISNVVHEIKTPLTLIKTPLNTLLAANSPDEKTQASLQVISNGVNALDNLSKDLLSYIRVENSAYKVDIQEVDVSDIIRLLSFNFKDVMKDRNLRYSMDCKPNPLYARADTKSVNIILNNLIGNAVKYSETWIEVNAVLEGNKVIVSVKNDGPLIPPDKTEEIFKPFVSLDTAKDAYKHSFGIGLPFSRKLAELQDARLELVPGNCNEFRLVLNAGTEPAVTLGSNKLDEDSTQRATILIIEDNVQLCDYLSEKISKDYNVLSAYSAERGISLLASKVVDVVVSDLNMPGIGGEALCRRISTDFDTSHIPIIVISALTDEDLKLKCIESGASIFIEKPFTIEFLKANISNLLEKMSGLRTSASNDTSGRYNLSRFGIKDRDEEFLKKLSNVVDLHLDDSEFTVKQLEEELFISHSSLNRKLTGLLRMTPIEFIRMRRLVAAAKILEGGKANISEVAFMVGFSTPTYFTKCFRKQFGLTPREFAERKLE